MLPNQQHDRRLAKQTIARHEAQKAQDSLHGPQVYPIQEHVLKIEQQEHVGAQSEFAIQQDQIQTRKATKKGMQQCECQPIFVCV